MRDALLCLIAAAFLQYFIFGAEFRQEMAKIDFYDPNYISDLKILTSRTDRQSSYKTNVNLTTLVTWGNNVTIYLKFQNIKTKAEAFYVTAKLCDFMKWAWVESWIVKYTNISKECPVVAGRYHIENAEIPPKHLPIFLERGDYLAILAAETTSKKNKIGQLSVIIKTKGNKI